MKLHLFVRALISDFGNPEVLLQYRAFAVMLYVQTYRGLAYSERRDSMVKYFCLLFVAAAHRRDDPQALTCKDWQIPPGTPYSNYHGHKILRKKLTGMGNLVPLFLLLKAHPAAGFPCLELGEGAVLLAEWTLANVLALKSGLLWSIFFSLSPFTGEMVVPCLILDKHAILKQHSCS